MGKYLYCLIEPAVERKYMGPGVNRSLPIYIIRYRDVAAVVSDIDKDVIKATTEDCLLHEKVIDDVMKDSTVLPFEFGTVSPDKDSIEALLKDNYSRIKSSVRNLRDKIEVNLMAIWSDMNKIFQEIVSENMDIAIYKKEIEKKPAGQTYDDRIRIGQLVAQALYVKREKEMDSILGVLKKTTAGYTPERVIGDNVVLNAAFLIKKGNLSKFESVLYGLDNKLSGRINFKYAGPLPPFNFTNLKLAVRS